VDRARRLRSKGVVELMGNANLQCDFCSAPCPTWRYPARSFIAYRASNLAGESVGDWAACDACHELIEADDRQHLAERSLNELILKHPEARAAAEILLQDLAQLHRQFFEHRHGPAVPVADAA
jgi:heterodisulfide reductase subunit C